MDDRRKCQTATATPAEPGDLLWSSKYPPAEPGALGMGPLEAAVGVADAAQFV